LRYWFLVFLFVAGSGLFFLGLYLMGVRDDWLGAYVFMAGTVLLLIFLIVAVFYAAYVRVKILRDASKF
jgi:hypothetical protein